MTSTRDGWGADSGSRAEDSAECLLVVGGYRHNADRLNWAVGTARDQIMMSPTLADFFDLRFVDMGVAPVSPTSNDAGVARLVLELTSRPGEAARNFSALLVVDQSATTVERVLRDCQGDQVLADLRVKSHGLASKDDRQQVKSGQQAATPKIDISPKGKWLLEDLAAEICGYAEALLGEFGSGQERGLPTHRLDELEAQAELEHRSVADAAAEAEARAAFEAARAKRERDERERAERERKAERERAERERVERERKAERERLQRERAEFEKRERAELEKKAERERAKDRKSDEAERERRYAEAMSRAAEAERLHAEAPDRRHAESGSHDDVPAKDRDEVPADAEAPASAPSAKEPGQLPPREPRAELQRAAGTLIGALDSGADLLGKFIGRLGAGQDTDQAGSSVGERMLMECRERLQVGDEKGFKARLKALRGYADAEIGEQERQRYQDIVSEGRLLVPGLPLGSSAVSFYEVLIRLAFGLPLSYQGYCAIEGYLAMGGVPGGLPSRPLLEAIDKHGPTDVRVLAITRYQLGLETLDKWFRSSKADKFDVGKLIAAIDGEWDRPGHVDLLYDVTLRYLYERQEHYDPRRVASALGAHGYLAAAALERYPGSRPHQVRVLASFLRAAYPWGLDRSAVAEIFAESAPTRALPVAIYRVLTDPADRPWVARAFARRAFDHLLGSDEIDAETVDNLVRTFVAEARE